MIAVALPALSGAVFGGGAYLGVRTTFLTPSRSTDSLAWARQLTRRLERWTGTGRLRRILIEKDLAVVGRDPAAHTAARLGRALTGALLGVLATLAISAVGLPLPFLTLPAIAALGIIIGVATADRPVRRLAAERRQEVRLAVAAFVDLVRIMLVGGMPLHAALRVAADSGQGWAFTEIRDTLDWARARRVAPDAGFDRLARAVPVPEFTELRLTIASALRGASPVQALASKATHIRAAEAAQARTDAATADAELELPAAVVALAFVAFLTYPLLVILTATQVTP